MTSTRYKAVVSVLSLALTAAAWSQDGNQGRSISVAYRDADIRRVISGVAKATGKRFIIHPDVDALVSVEPASAMTVSEYYDLLETILETKGFEALEVEEIAYIVPIGVPSGTGTLAFLPGAPEYLDRTIRITRNEEQLVIRLE